MGWRLAFWRFVAKVIVWPGPKEDQRRAWVYHHLRPLWWVQTMAVAPCSDCGKRRPLQHHHRNETGPDTNVQSRSKPVERLGEV